MTELNTPEIKSITAAPETYYTPIGSEEPAEEVSLVVATPVADPTLKLTSEADVPVAEVFTDSEGKEQVECGPNEHN
jgi:hypothetical protein